MKTWRCLTCQKDFHHLGIARHRAMHKDKKEECKLENYGGERFYWDYRERKVK